MVKRTRSEGIGKYLLLNEPQSASCVFGERTLLKPQDIKIGFSIPRGILFSTGTDLYVYLPTRYHATSVAYRLRTSGESYTSDNTSIKECKMTIHDEINPDEILGQLSFNGKEAILRDANGGITKPAILKGTELEWLQKQVTDTAVSIVALPVVRGISHAFKTAAGEYVVLVTDQNSDLSSAKLYVGAPGNLKEQPNVKAGLLDDGASISVVTGKNDILYIPTPGRAKNFMRPTDWKAEPVTPVTADDAKTIFGNLATKALGPLRPT